MLYRALWFLEAALILILAFVLMVPIEDYALQEYKEYLRNPSPETLQAFQNKAAEESRVRGIIATSAAAVAFSLAIPIVRIRRRATKVP